ncbi:calcium-transporting ATPase 2, plasma membrane-type-like isoform X2 [Nicotiana sylvestris]|uniref:calcium-transporting ATPase 2, plasma membrane-type-like isoform X2 n=1 Tax=Nicotiana sylvestris TaxID=4096 RepID=UPI00388CDF02
MLRRWRSLCGVVKNPKRRFRFTANLSKRYEAAAMRRTNHEKLRVAVLVSKAAFQFISGVQVSDYTVPDEVKDAGFQIDADELGSIVEGHDLKKVKFHGGVEGIANKLATSSTDGLSTRDYSSLIRRQEIFGINKFQESEARSFWLFVWEALQDMTLMILGACAFVSLLVGIAMEGWPVGAHDGLGKVTSILLVVFVTATSDYRQSLQFRDLDKEKKKISIQVTRNGYRQKMSIYDLVPGDVVHLAIGDQVPADGLFLSGFSVLIDESSLTGESVPVMVSAQNPFLLSGTKVQDGSCKMLVTTVGMRTQWGKLLATLSEGGDDETLLQVKLNGVATIIGKIGLFFAIVTFAVLVQKMYSRKLTERSHWSWSAVEARELLEYFAIAVTIVVVAVPEGLPLAVTLSLAFAMKKMMNDKALVRHLAACETMGSATTFCSDKTGTLTTNRMTVVKTCFCMNIKDVTKPSDASAIRSDIPDSVLKTLLQSIFNNTGGEVVATKHGKPDILGTPTETAILQFGLALGGDFQAERQAGKLIKVEPLNSTKKRMGVVLELPEGGLRAHTKGASEIILAACDKVAKESADVIILDDNFSTIVRVAKWGRSVYINIQKFVQFQLTVNIVALIVNFLSACFTGTAPLTAVQLLWVNMIMDTLGALALATEPPHDELMKRAPVGRSGNFISNVMWRNILGQSLYQFLVIWFLQSNGMGLFRLNGPDAQLTLNTIIFNTFVFCQLFKEVNSREMEKVEVWEGMLDNYVFVAVLSITLVFQIIIVEYLGTFANTTPLSFIQWFLSIFFGFLSMPVAVGLKRFEV